MLTFFAMSEFNWQCLFQVLPHCDLLNDCSMSVSESSAPSKDDLLLPMDIISTPVTGVRVIHHNVRGVLSKFPEIAHWLSSSQNPTVLCCSETWLGSNDLHPSVAGFDMFCSPVIRHPDKTTSILPGSCMFVSKSLSSSM